MFQLLYLVHGLAGRAYRQPQLRGPSTRFTGRRLRHVRTALDTCGRGSAHPRRRRESWSARRQPGNRRRRDVTAKARRICPQACASCPVRGPTSCDMDPFRLREVADGPRDAREHCRPAARHLAAPDARVHMPCSAIRSHPARAYRRTCRHSGFHRARSHLVVHRPRCPWVTGLRPWKSGPAGRRSTP